MSKTRHGHPVLHTARNLVVAMLALSAGATGAQAATSDCVPVSNVQAIIDDSGSMKRTDAAEFRRVAMELLIAKPGNAGLTLGATQFGSTAKELFAPANVGANAASMTSSLAAQLLHDDGSTNYNDAFSVASAANPTAGARIFLTDGRHNRSIYTNGHRGGPPTYVIALGPKLVRINRRDRLRMIASETGGKLFIARNPAKLQSVINSIDVLLDCGQDVSSGTSTGSELDQVADTITETPEIPADSKNVDVVVTWANSNNAFDIYKSDLEKSGLNVTVIKQETSLLVRINRSDNKDLPTGKLKIKLKATKVANPEPVTVQVSATPQS